MRGTATRAGIVEYLILLSICETCEYQGLDFLDFLRSGEKDIEAFAQLRRRKRGVGLSSGSNNLPGCSFSIGEKSNCAPEPCPVNDPRLLA
jgi:hypothetical protein